MMSMLGLGSQPFAVRWHTTVVMQPTGGRYRHQRITLSPALSSRDACLRVT
jgi:hypothetical protein